MTLLFFDLLRASIGEQTGLSRSFSSQEWEGVYEVCRQQGVVGLVFDFVKTLPKTEAPDLDLLMEWLSVTTNVEMVMQRLQQLTEELAERMAEREIPMAVLKGLAFSQYYPNPLHREFGDLDCFLMGKKAEGDLLISELGGTMEEASYKHSHLIYKGVTIENHQFFTDFNNTPIGIATERLLAQLIQEGCSPLGDTHLLCPPPLFNALFLLKHAQSHFISEGIRMRHVLDWALFLQKEQDTLDWSRLLSMLETTRTMPFAALMTAIASQDLHVPIHNADLQAQTEGVDRRLLDAVLADIMGDQPAIYVDGLWHKTKRILRRFRRMWKFRSLASESYPRMVWNAFAFSSYMRHESISLQQETCEDGCA